jgi:GT2 family glycosyltransferase
MTEWPPVIALIITYERTNLALQTIRSIKERLDYPNVGFHIADDGSNPNHVPRLISEIGGSYAVTVSNSGRRGVGVNMNLGMAECLKRADFILWLEDDWVLPQSLDLKPCVELLHGHSDLGMIRLGRMSPGLHGECFSAAGKYWWRLFRNHGDAYTFSGNAALRHRRFCMT